jgi:hypothetical protein
VAAVRSTDFVERSRYAAVKTTGLQQRDRAPWIAEDGFLHGRTPCSKPMVRTPGRLEANRAPSQNINDRSYA